MSEEPLGGTAGELDPEEGIPRELMAFRVHEVLLVASLYDLFILEEDGQLSESLDAEFYERKLSFAPRITLAATADEALALLEARPIDLVITMARLGGMEVRQFSERVKARFPGLPVVMLADNQREAYRIKTQPGPPAVDQVFVWRGDVALFLAIVKYVEDQRNAERDVSLGGVRMILLVENSVRFYSSYLPMLYTELVAQGQAVLADGVNARERLRRMRARPKILLAETFEDARDLFERFRSSILGIITDVRFPRAGRADPEAGIELLRQIRQEDPDLPVLVQSSDAGLREKSLALGASFASKRSPRLLDELHHFIRRNLGFGDFVFVDPPTGQELLRVKDLAGMPGALARVPAASLRHHASRNHFSNWCTARTEFALAARIRPRKVSEFESTEELRRYLIDAFSGLLAETRRVVVADFARQAPAEAEAFSRLGSGSMGGKGRGLGFIHSLLGRQRGGNVPPGVHLFVPPTTVLGTGVFGEFMRSPGLARLAFSDAPDEEIEAAFLAAPLPPSTEQDLAAFLETARYPLAVRSSSLLEDSHDKPFAGIFRTIMLANNAADPDVRLRQLAGAIKLVYASTYSGNSKAYLQQTPHSIEEEKMAVIVQQLVGRTRGTHFYPDFAGVAQSYNYYPMLGLEPEDGVAAVALGLGRTVVDGGRTVRFSPGAPRSAVQFAGTASTLKGSQRQFWALDMSGGADFPDRTHEDALVQLDLAHAERDGTLGRVASTYSRDNDAFYPGVGRAGIRVVTFDAILRMRLFPLAEVLRALLALGEQAMSCPVEIEFAVNLPETADEPAEFGVLQIRPLAIDVGAEDIDRLLEDGDRDAVLCDSPQALGRGHVAEIRDIVYVRGEAFDRARTVDIAREVEMLNRRLVAENRPYLLIGPGRWGTSDNWLGIPVEWRMIAGARAIIETDLDDVEVTPSEGSHFFHNIASFGTGYLTVHQRRGSGFVDFDWLAAHRAETETAYLRHVRLGEPLDVRIDGRSGRGVILKP